MPRVARLDAQGALPTKLVQASDVTHLGSFTLPTGSDFNFTHGIIAFNPARNSLFVVGSDPDQEVAEVSIPAMGGRATLLQGFRDPFEGRINQTNPNSSSEKKIGGMFIAGDRLILTAYTYYDGSASASTSHFVRSTTLTTTGVQGPFDVGNMNPGFYAGYMTPVPSVWQSLLGGDVMGGQCCLSIISRTSYGPSGFAMTKAGLLAQNTPATPLVYYNESHQTLGQWDKTSQTFNGTTKIKGAVIPEGTRSALWIGKHGTGSYCYGEGSSCGDPEDGDKGSHAYPYRAQVWAYDVNDLVAVRNGSKQPWDIRPYATWGLPGMGYEVGGVAIDPATGRIFVAENYGNGNALRIHVYSVNGSGGATPPSGGGDTAGPTVSLSAPSAGASVSGTLNLSASASDNVGVAGVWFTIDGATVGSEDTSAPYSLSWNSRTVGNGSHSLRAVARDGAGNTTQSAARTITVNNASADTTAPTVSLTTPAANATISGTVTVSASASDNTGVASVQFTLDGNNLGAADTSSPYSISWNTRSASNASHVLRAVARDAAGNVTNSSTRTVRVNNASSDTQAPSVSLTAPSNGTKVSGTVMVSASATDNAGIASVQFTLNGVNLGAADTSAPFAVNWSTTGAVNGTHVLRAVARDTAGNVTTSASRSVSVQNTTSSCSTPDPFRILGGGTCYNGNWLPPGMNPPSNPPSNPPANPPSSTPPPSIGCLSLRPGLSWTCVNGGWLPPGILPPAAPSTPSTPSAPSTPPPSTGCLSLRPGLNWTCVNGGWLPPGILPPATPPPTTTPPPSSTTCTTPRPGASWSCVNGGWLPPGIASIIGGLTSSVSSTSNQSDAVGCSTPAPGASWVCRNGGWLPPDHPEVN